MVHRTSYDVYLGANRLEAKVVSDQKLVSELQNKAQTDVYGEVVTPHKAFQERHPELQGNPLDRYHEFLTRHPELSTDSKNMLKLFPYILELQAQKAAVYGRSYCHHGDLSIFLNVERKWDRISNIMDRTMKKGSDNLYAEGTATETLVDTVVDLASYGLLWVGYIMENHPEAFQKFLQSNHLQE